MASYCPIHSYSLTKLPKIQKASKNLKEIEVWESIEIVDRSSYLVSAFGKLHFFPGSRNGQRCLPQNSLTSGQVLA